MNQIMTIFTNRELFLLLIIAVTYVALFVLVVQNSRRKILSLQERLNKVHAMEEEQMAVNKQSIERNQQKIDQLESLIQKLGDENSVLRLQLEERKAHLDYVNTLSKIEGEKRRQAETTIFGSEVYQKMKELLNSVYTNFTERLYSLYNLTSQDYHVSLLIKVRIPPKDIAVLTAHSKESVATTRSRLYQKVFGKKGSSKDWDDFILSL